MASTGENAAQVLSQVGLADAEQCEEARRRGMETLLREACMRLCILTADRHENLKRRFESELDGLPAQLGQYRLIRALGSGGMGAVYPAEDAMLDRKADVKVPPEPLAIRDYFG